MVRRWRHSKKRRVFSERQREAILRIAQAPIETKNHTVTITWAQYLTNTLYTAPAFSHAGAYNFLGPIPRQTSVVQGGTTGIASFIGDELNLRGLRFEFNLYSLGNGNPGAVFDGAFRFTVYRINVYAANYRQIIPADEEVTPEGVTTPTWFKWRSENVDILYQRKFRIDNNGNRNSIMNKKFWVRMNRKCVSVDEDYTGGAAYETFGENKSGNFIGRWRFWPLGQPTSQRNLLGIFLL